MKRTCVLVVLDGWGIGEPDASNPIHVADLPTIKFIETNFPAGTLQASGITVGLPWEEEGNSEVGHLTLGAGKILYQYYPRISLAVRNKNFFTLPRLKQVFAHAKKTGGSVHLAGLLTTGNVHAAWEHLDALLEMAKRETCASLFLHIFTDGRDSDPHSAKRLIEKLEETAKAKGVGKIASVVGRYYAMDRDRHFERTKEAYELLVRGKGFVRPIEESIQKVYSKDLNDEYIEPTAPNGPMPVKNGDALLFFNFREDRMRQLSEPFLNPKFSQFPIEQFKDLFIATMTEYHKEIPGYEVFDREMVNEPLGKTLADAEKTQLRIAETEKYAHVTYFFNGLREEPFPNEYRILIPSQSVSRHDERPEMMATAITDRAISTLQEGSTDFILVNYANADMVAHTGNFDATLKAVRVVDAELSRLLRVALDGGHSVIITADHGNAERLLDVHTGEQETRHNVSPVPFYLVARDYAQPNRHEGYYRLPPLGILSDVAPTVLALMGIPKPAEMTGESLLEQLR
ncbi:MAG: 2,3-bisphosphoglycerate-independent phosphoglycerate mutase [Patescibacteria group bacterium]